MRLPGLDGGALTARVIEVRGACARGCLVAEDRRIVPTDLMEWVDRPQVAAEGVLDLDLGAFAIETFRILCGVAATQHDLAAACACTVSTVSRALRDDARISTEMRARVHAAAARLGYRANLAARTLVTGRSGTVWFLLAGLSSPTDHLPAEAAARRCRDQGLDLLVAAHRDDAVAHERLVVRLRQGLADGALVAASDCDRSSVALRELAVAGFPLVFIDRHVPGLAVPVATTDHQAAVGLLVDALVESGACAVVDLHRPQCNSVEAARAVALAAACRRHRLPRLDPGVDPPPGSAVVASGSWQVREWWEGGRRASCPFIGIHDQWPGDPPADAIVLACEQDFDAMATAAWDLLAARLAGAATEGRLVAVAPQGVRRLGPGRSAVG